MLIQIVCGVGDTLVPMQWLIQELNYFVVMNSNNVIQLRWILCTRIDVILWCAVAIWHRGMQYYSNVKYSLARFAAAQVF